MMLVPWIQAPLPPPPLNDEPPPPPPPHIKIRYVPVDGGMKVPLPLVTKYCTKAAEQPERHNRWNYGGNQLENTLPLDDDDAGSPARRLTQTASGIPASRATSAESNTPNTNQHRRHRNILGAVVSLRVHITRTVTANEGTRWNRAHARQMPCIWTKCDENGETTAEATKTTDPLMPG